MVQRRPGGSLFSTRAARPPLASLPRDPRRASPWPCSWPRPTGATSAGGPTAKLASKAAYRSAKLSYDHDYADAISTSHRAALDHPQAEEAEYATNLVLDAYNELVALAEAQRPGKRFFATQALVTAHPKLKDDLPKVIEHSVEEQERQAAESYLAFVRAAAPHNASVDYARASRVDKSMGGAGAVRTFPADPWRRARNASGYTSSSPTSSGSADAYERYFRERRSPAKAPPPPPVRKREGAGRAGRCAGGGPGLRGEEGARRHQRGGLPRRPARRPGPRPTRSPTPGGR